MYVHEVRVKRAVHRSENILTFETKCTGSFRKDQTCVGFK